MHYIFVSCASYYKRKSKIVVYRPVAALRHVPKQQRGMRQVHKILHSAEVVFAEMGYEHATTNAIAAQAGVSIGSLYQFFVSKDAILEALAQGYLDQTKLELGKLLETKSDQTLSKLLSEIVETLVKLQEQRPYFLQCLAQNRAYAVLHGSVLELNRVILVQVTRMMQKICIPQDAAVVQRKATVCVYTVSALLPLALEAHGRARAKLISEIVQLLNRYIEPELRTTEVE